MTLPPASIRTVGELRQYMETHGLSPEKLAPAVNISNMTIRRILRQKDGVEISGKYHASLDRLFSMSPGAEAPGPASPLKLSLNSILNEIEQVGQAKPNLPKLERDLDAKLKDPALERPIRGKIQLALSIIRDGSASTTARALMIGALIYVINPFDLVPDAIPGLGYLDDFAVLTLALEEVLRRGAKKQQAAMLKAAEV